MKISIQLRLVGFLFTVLTTQCIARSAPLVITDDLGRVITLSHAPQRIVSLEPSVTEVIYAVGGQTKLVADDLYSDYPAAAKLLPHVSGIGPSREMVAGLHPDLLILFDQTFTKEKADQWSQSYGLPVYVTNAGTYGGVEADIEKIGSLVGNRAATNAVIANMDAAKRLVSDAVRNLPRPKVFVVVWDHPLMTAGRGTFIDSLITIAGGRDVASDSVAGYPTYSPERLVFDDPDVLLTGNSLETPGKQDLPGLSALGLRAEKEGRSYSVPDDWTVRPGPRLALGLQAIAKLLHPNRFH